MEKEEKNRGKLDILIKCLMIVLSLITVLMCTFCTKRERNDYLKSPTFLINENWKHGEEDVNLPYHIELEKGEYFEINRTVDDKLFRNHNIYFQSERFGIEVYINDTLIYSLNRNDAFVNRIHVDTMMLVRLDKAEIGDTLKIRFINIENEKIIKDLPNIYAGSVMAFMDKISAEESITFISFILMTALLIVFIGFIIISLKKNMLEKRFISFTLFMIACAIWLLTDSSVLSIYPVSYEAVAIVSYFASKCMPLGILYFSKQSYKDGKTILIDIAIAITFANVIGSSIILLFSLIPLSKLVIVDQVVLIISAVACMLYNILFIKRNKNQTQPKILLTDFIVISILGICGLICYYLYDSFVYHKIITLAIVVFVIGLIAIMIYSSLQDSKLKKKMMKERELFKELSYKDELTGLGNVRAYNEKLDTLFNNNNDFTLIIIDVNNIKRINDSYGHGAGNIVLLQCAQCMSKTFEQYNGTSYRIGGDEFACIVDSDSFDAQTVIDNFNDIIKATNGDRIYKLSAAVGYSGSKDKDVHTVQDLKFHADLSMYKDKSNKKSREDDKENEEWRRMIETVVSIFEVKDPYTAQHSNRVSYISKFIAQSMGLTEVVVNDVFIAGRIHDIGKIGISDNILTKKGKLTNEEFAEIKKHPEIGEKVILSSGGLNKIAKIVRHHHEKFNGGGYPDGISKDDIPLESRILAFSDMIDAMTSDRCYRKALSYEECKKEIENCLGIALDPTIGKVVLDNWDEIVSIHQELKSELD